MRSTPPASHQHTTQTARRSLYATAWAAAFLAFVACWVVFAAVVTPSGSASAHDLGKNPNSGGPTGTPVRDAPEKAKTPDGPVNMTPVREQNFEGWERPALRDLAQVVAWPTSVTYDNAGRLRVQNWVSDDNWAVAHIRGFDYQAGASAAFLAEQEDARLAGFSITRETFYSYPAYVSLLTDNAGTSIEKRFRWQAGTWILGVDIRDATAGHTPGDPRLTAEELLTLAVNRGMPAPPSQVPTANPTWVLPPASSPTPTARGCTFSMHDVPTNYWAYSHIARLVCDGVISGYSDGTFRPENSTTRGQLAKMLVLSQHWPLVSPATAQFRDVGLQHAFYLYIETAAAHGVISGYSDGTFRPDVFVTRAQVAKMLVLARNWAPATTFANLCDVNVGHWAYSYVQTAIQHGVFSGYGDSCFRPNMEATRAQLTKVLSLSSR